MSLKSLSEIKQRANENVSELVDLSIIIVNWNTRVILSNCLKSIFDFIKDVSIEVIVVDNGSTDRSTEIVKRDFPMVILIENNENLGFAKANNQGIKLCRGRYVFLLNSDTLIKSSFRQLLHYMDSHKNIGIASPKTLNTDGTIQPSGGCDIRPYHYFLKILNLYNPQKPLLGRGRIKNVDYKKITEVETISGSAMIIRREVFRTIGMLDESFFFYNEEMDFCRRVRYGGWKVYYLPLAEIVHFKAASAKDSTINEMLQTEAYKSNLYFFDKYFSKISYEFLRCFYRSSFIIKIIIVIFRWMFQRDNAELYRREILLKWRMFKI